MTNLERGLHGVISAHQGHTCELVAVADGTARGVWAMSDYLSWPVDAGAYFGRSAPGQWGVRGYGFYEDEYRRTAAGWRISRSRLVRLRLDPLVGEPPPDLGFPVLRHDPHWLVPTGTTAIDPQKGEGADNG